MGFLLLFMPLLHAEDAVMPRVSKSAIPAKTEATASAFSKEEKKAISERPPLVLKLMIVNPSTKYKQTYPLKAYLPEEIKPDYIVGKEDLEIGYDADKKVYYVTKEVELEPGASVVKSLKVEDIWFIAETELNQLSEEAHDLYDKLKNTQYAEQGRLLMNNIEVLLMQILERQNNSSLAPDAHISVYRENRQKMHDMEMDLMSLRRFLAAAGDPSFLANAKAQNGALGALFSRWAETTRRNGNIPAYLLWKVIFSILIFVGMMTLLFVVIWQQQMRMSLRRRSQMERPEAPPKDSKKEEVLKISEFYPGIGEEKLKDHHAA